MRLLELGGPQKLLDTMSVAARKAQRENLKLKALKEEIVLGKQKEFVDGMYEQLAAQGPEFLQGLAMEGYTPEMLEQEITQSAPPMVPVDDFDLHEVHLEEHNRYRMSQEYETLPDIIKAEFQKHCESHEQFLQQAMAMQMMMANMGQGGPGGPGGPAGAGPEGAAGPGEPSGGGTPGPQPMPDSMSAEQPAA
jgi:hypothetical protein